MEQSREPRNRPTQIHPTDFDKGIKAIQWRKHTPFLRSGAGASGHPLAKKREKERALT